MRKAIPPVRIAREAPGVRELAGLLAPDRASFEAERARFEAAYAAANGGREAVLTPTGRDGLRFLLETLARPGARRIVLPAYGDASLLETAHRLGLEPTPCDVRRLDGTLDPDRLAPLLGPDVVAVVVIHLYGRPAAALRIAEIAAARGIPVIEDCAHAPIAPFTPRSRALSVASFTSLAPFKLVDCGGGGVVCTSDPELARQVRARAQSLEPTGALTSVARALGALAVAAATAPRLYDAVGHRVFVRLARGGGVLPFYKKVVRPLLKRDADAVARRLPGAPFLRAGLSQLASLPGRLAERRRLSEILGRGVPEGALLVADPLEASAEYAQIAVVREPEETLARLGTAGVDALPAPMSFWADGACPVGALLARRAIELPWFDGMTEADVARVRDALLESDRSAPRRRVTLGGVP